MDGRDLLRADATVFGALILTPGEQMPILALIVAVLATGAAVVVGVLGYLIEKSSERAERE
jgi:hypothetical protein